MHIALPGPRHRPARLVRIGLATVIALTWCAALANDLAITHVHVYPAPGAPRLDDVTVIIREGRISAVGGGLEVGDVPVLDGRGAYLTAGLWNCHVHLIDPELLADPGPGLRDMLLSRGFTSMLDTGSTPGDAQRIIEAIAAGEYPGPTIHVAGGSFVYTGGTPVYLPGIKLPELARAEEAAPAVNAVLDAGADGIKIFSGSFMGRAATILLPPDIIAAVTAAAHARGSFVVAHPTDRAGLVNAVDNGVDILAHTAPPAGPLGDDLVQRMRERRVALIPTLKLWAYELDRSGAPAAERQAFQQAGIDQLAEYAAAGGEILFGTDVGYMPDFDTTMELEAMHSAGMDFAAILTAMTTAPAHRFGGGGSVVAAGQPGDVALFRNDPASDVTALSHAMVTVRAGQVVYREDAATDAAATRAGTADGAAP